MASFTLDSSRLVGVDEEFVESIIEDRGRFVELEWTLGGTNQDIELFGWAIRFKSGESMVMAAPGDAFVSADYAYVDTPLEDRGRAIQLEWTLGGTNQDIELFGYAIRFAPGSGHAMESS